MIIATVTGEIQRGRNDAPAIVTKSVGGSEVTEFTISVYHGKNKRSGEHERSYVRVSMWGKIGGWFAERYAEGDTVGVYGEMKLRKYEGGASLEMRADGYVKALKGSGGEQRQQSQGNQGVGYGSRAGSQDYSRQDDSSIPF